ncbi:MAG: hypothetical protein GY725_15905 [bacterium]|nr:hypothetical protein [bacterium]
MVGIYVLVFGSLLVATDFLPYVFDNNESFSAYFHALNLHDYGFEKSFGITDESFAFHAEAHPYAYTHGGNFPRFPVLLLYVLGARTVEMQIAISTFTFGLATILMAFALFRRLANAEFAAVACTLLITDYLMFAQWNVGTWRVWQGFLFFASMHCALGCTGSKRRTWLALTFPVFVSLFYCELVFATQVAILAALWAGWELRERPVRVLTTWTIQLSSAFAGAGIIVWHNVKYLGREGFLTDLRLTFLARNTAMSPEALSEQARSFAEANHLAFWYSFSGEDSLRNLSDFLENFFRFELGIYSPALVLLALTLLLGLAGNAASIRLDSWAAKPQRAGRVRWPSGPMAVSAFSVLFALFAITVITDSSFVNALRKEYPGSSLFKGFESVGLVLGSLAILLWCRAALSRIWSEAAPGARSAATLALPFLLAAFVLFQHNLYSKQSRPLWAAVAEPWGTVVILKLAIIAAAGYGSLVVAGRHRDSSTPGFLRPLRGLGPFVGFAFLSYSIIYLISPGYLRSGYLVRYAPFTVYFHLVPFAIALYTTICWAREEISRWSRSSTARERTGSDEGSAGARAGFVAQLSSLAPLAISVGVAAFFTAYWLIMQVMYVGIFQPDHYGFLRELRKPIYQGASFVASNYAAPVAAFTGNWAYYDPDFQKGEIAIGDDGYEVSREFKYLWLADRLENPDYRTPGYFICMVPQNMYRGASLSNRRRPVPRHGCSNLGIVKMALESGPKLLSHELVARDQSGRDHWAILKLDWDYPPYLKELDGRGNRVNLCAERSSGDLRVRVDYEYAQQQGKPETGSSLQLYLLSESAEEPKRLAQSENRSEILLPADFIGEIRAGVTPATATKTGEEFLSAPVEILGSQSRSGNCYGMQARVDSGRVRQ